MVSAKTIGKAVREHRRSVRLTQAQLGEAIGKTPDAISQIERGINMPSVETIAALSRRLGVPIDALVFPDGSGEEVSARESNIKRMESLLRSLDDRDFKIALKQIEAFDEK